jgi:hypothetical protein
MNWLRWLRFYSASNDPSVAACNTIAMMIASNQPFYPIYIWWIAGSGAWVGIPDALSGIVFFAVPAVTRRFPLLGRVALVVVSVVNVVICSAMLGEPAGVQLLFMPCAMLAAILFTWRERFVMITLTSLPLAAWLLTRGKWDTPPIRFTPDAYRGLFTLNALSAGSLMIVFGWILAGIHRPPAAG